MPGWMNHKLESRFPGEISTTSDMQMCACAKLLQLCPVLCYLMDCSPSGSSSIHGMLQARIMEWVALPSSRWSSWPRDRTYISQVSWIGKWILYHSHHLEAQICRWYHSNGRKWRETKEPLDEGVRGELKSWLKTQHSKSKIMASDPITSRQVKGRKVKAAAVFLFLGSQIPVDGDGSHEIKRHFLLGRKAVTYPDSALKTRDITLPTKVCIVEAMVFPVGM